MESTQRFNLRRNQMTLVDELDPRDVIDSLYEDGVLTENDCEHITAGNTRKDQCRLLLTLLPTRGPSAYISFQKALKTDYAHLARLLWKPVKSPVQNKQNKGEIRQNAEDSDQRRSILAMKSNFGNSSTSNTGGCHVHVCHKCRRLIPKFAVSTLGNAIKRNCCLILENIEANDLLDLHYQEFILGADACDQVRSGKTRVERCIIFISELSKCRNRKVLLVFRRSLKKKYGYIIGEFDKTTHQSGTTIDVRNEISGPILAEVLRIGIGVHREMSAAIPGQNNSQSVNRSFCVKKQYPMSTDPTSSSADQLVHSNPPFAIDEHVDDGRPFDVVDHVDVRQEKCDKSYFHRYELSLFRRSQLPSYKQENKYVPYKPSPFSRPKIQSYEQYSNSITEMNRRQLDLAQADDSIHYLPRYQPSPFSRSQLPSYTPEYGKNADEGDMAFNDSQKGEIGWITRRNRYIKEEGDLFYRRSHLVELHKPPLSELSLNPQGDPWDDDHIPDVRDTFGEHSESKMGLIHPGNKSEAPIKHTIEWKWGKGHSPISKIHNPKESPCQKNDKPKHGDMSDIHLDFSSSTDSEKESQPWKSDQKHKRGCKSRNSPKPQYHNIRNCLFKKDYRYSTDSENESNGSTGDRKQINNSERQCHTTCSSLQGFINDQRAKHRTDRKPGNQHMSISEMCSESSFPGESETKTDKIYQVLEHSVPEIESRSHSENESRNVVKSYKRKFNQTIKSKTHKIDPDPFLQQSQLPVFVPNPGPMTSHNQRSKRHVLAFNLLSTLVNQCQFQKFDLFAANIQRKYDDDLDMLCIVDHLTASRDMFITDLDSAKKHISAGLKRAPKTSNPRNFALDFLAALTRMYLRQRKLLQFESLLCDAKMIIETDPVGCSGRAVGWLYVNDVTHICCQIAMLNVHSTNYLAVYKHLQDKAVRSCQMALQNFQRDCGNDGPIGSAFVLCRLAILLLRCGDNGLTMDMLYPDSGEIALAQKYIRHLEESHKPVPPSLEIHLLLAKCDYAYRRDNYGRALGHAESAYKLATDINMLEFTEHAHNRVVFLRTKAPLVIQSVDELEASKILFGDST